MQMARYDSASARFDEVGPGGDDCRKLAGDGGVDVVEYTQLPRRRGLADT